MLSLLLLGLVAFSQMSSTQADSCGRIVCYFTNWSQYRTGDGKFTCDKINPNLCTHLIFAFAKLSGNSLAPFEWNDESTDWSVGNYEKCVNLKKTNPNLKVMLAVGGWNLGSAPFTQMVQSASSRQQFINQSIDYLRTRDFDGLDLDWEYPANRGSPPEDKHRFSLLIKELKQAYANEASRTGKSRLLLSAAVAAGKNTIDTAYEVSELSKELDFINLMTYDLHGSWEKVTGHNSPLYPRFEERGDQSTLNVDYAVNYWVQKGADKSKLTVGLGLYGRSFTLTNASNYQIGDPASGAGQVGQYTKEAGFLSYYEVCDLLKAGGKEEYSSEQWVPFAHLNTQWVGYENPDSIGEKVRYIKNNNYGGVMVWALPLDDFTGTHCGEGPYPLMQAIDKLCQHSTDPLPVPVQSQTTSNPVVASSSINNVPEVRPNPPEQNEPAQPTQRPPQTQQPVDTGDVSGFCKGRRNGIYAYPSDCKYFIICSHGTSFRTQCPENTYWNKEVEACDHITNTSCDYSTK